MTQIDGRTTFGMAKLGQGKTSVMFRMNAHTRHKLEQLALHVGRNLGATVELAIDELAARWLPETGSAEALERRAEAREQ